MLGTFSSSSSLNLCENGSNAYILIWRISNFSHEIDSKIYFLLQSYQFTINYYYYYYHDNMHWISFSSLQPNRIFCSLRMRQHINWTRFNTRDKKMEKNNQICIYEPNSNSVNALNVQFLNSIPDKYRKYVPTKMMSTNQRRNERNILEFIRKQWMHFNNELFLLKNHLFILEPEYVSIECLIWIRIVHICIAFW